MFRSDPSLLYAAITSLSSAFDSLNEADGMSSSLTSFPPDYPFSGEVNAILSDVKSAKADVSSLNRKISETKDRLCSLDTAFSLTYYACAAQKYESLDSLTDEQQAYLEYNQKQYYEQLYKYLDENKDNLTAEQKQIYEALKEKKVIEKKYEELQKLYKEKKENNGLLHPIIEGNINDEIKALEKELGIYQNKWYEDIGYAITKTGSEWGEGFSSLFAGEGFGELWDAAKQTVATGAVVCRSAESGVAKIGEWVVDGVAAVGGTIAAGATWLFHDTWSDNDVAGKVMDSTLDFVRRDLIGESNKNFYENTSVGQWINNNSNLKYDSAGAQTISTATRIAAEIVIATAAEVCTLGAATPLVIAMFAAEGVGQATESYVQSVNREDGDSYNYGKVLLTEALGGIGGAMKGRMYGKIGANCLQILENPSLITQGLNSLKDTGLKNLIKKDVTSGAFKVDAGMTFGQKVYEGYVEYNNTGDINWGKLGLSFLNELAISRITDNMMAMNLSGKLDIDNVKVLSSNVDYAEIQDAFDIMRYKFGDKEALFRIREALQTGNFNLITRDGNARMIFSTLSSTDFDNFLSSNFSKSASLKSMSDFYESLGNSYGQDQGAIKNLCDYYYNGQKLNYNQATSLVNDFVSKGYPIPYIRKVGTKEYFDLKNSIMNKFGFSERDASIIMSSVDDAGACSYASVCNEIFYKFKDNPQKFEEVFGYSMYKTANGTTSLNTSDLLMDLYIYSNDIKNGGKLILDDSLNVNCLSTKIDALGRSMPDVGNNQVYMSNGITGRNISTIDSFLKSKDSNLSFQSDIFFNNLHKGTYSDSDYATIMNMLKNRISNGETATIDYYYNANNNDTVIRMLSYDRSKYPDTSTAVWHEGAGHSTAITGIYDDGITISSWGNKYFIPKEDLQNGGRFMIMTSNIKGI